jgi:protoporphyrinogen/coproporphyrinogen III oxidase
VKNVCIIGGGISGLCAAYRLKKQGAQVTLVEKNSEVGGNIKSEKVDGFLIEHGPNTALATPELYQLIKELGLVADVATANGSAKKRYIVKNGTLALLPAGIKEFVTNRTFSVAAKLRVLREPFVTSKAPTDESISEFFTRRFGSEIVDYAVDPFISGIFAGDPARLSINHAFSRVFELEKTHGSIIRGALFGRKGKKPATPKEFKGSISFKNGMQTIVNRLERELGSSVQTSIEVVSLAKTPDGKFKVESTSKRLDKEVFDSVVLCTPAYVTAKIIEGLDEELAHRLYEIYYPPIAVVFTPFRCRDVKFDLDGFGVLLPSREKRQILGCLWTSSVFKNRAPDGFHLLTTFIGGVRDADSAMKTENAIAKIAIDELMSLLGITGEPVFTRVKKWPRAIPQYSIGYEKVLAAIENFKISNPGILFCSNYYKGISVGDCVKNGLAVAAEI